MKDLLRRWSKAEPERCDYYGDGVYKLIMDRESGDAWILDLARVSRHDRAMVRDIVEQAIEARGWWWALPNSRSTPWAYVDGESRDKYESVVAPHGYVKPICALSNDNPAAALLEAYLRAVEKLANSDDLDANALDRHEDWLKD